MDARLYLLSLIFFSYGMCNFVCTFCIFHLRPKIAFFSLSMAGSGDQVVGERPSTERGKLPPAAQAAPTERSAPVLSSALCSRVHQSTRDSTSVHQLCIPGGASLLSLTQAASEPDRPPGYDIDKLWLTQADTVCHSLASLTEAPPEPEKHPQVTWDLL